MSSPDKRLFQGIDSNTPCINCVHVRGHAAPNPMYWTCSVVREGRLVYFGFETVDRQVLVADKECSEFESR